MFYGYLADAMVAIHVGYVAFVVLGFVAVLLGMVFRWQWVRNPWFRCIHLAMIAFVAFESVIGMTCPLTTWENNLREKAGQSISAEDSAFVGRMMNQVLFCDWPMWVFNVVYIGFALLVVATFVFAPVRWRRRPTAAAPCPK